MTLRLLFVCLSVFVSVWLAGRLHDFPSLHASLYLLPSVICQAASLFPSCVECQAVHDLLDRESALESLAPSPLQSPCPRGGSLIGWAWHVDGFP